MNVYIFDFGLKKQPFDDISMTFVPEQFHQFPAIFFYVCVSMSSADYLCGFFIALKIAAVGSLES